ncbi:Asp-tRNA(Asn)/Glu-tRNA(Gln) amidotransferase subunit GatC [Candidatus Woesearchaeota archaeon]|nr:Asp-tRNA(Asn)/Glu-tRNA(Gln) amidotransferase subunit GatC [Candidatus Woesearchaeota archaeon]
MEMNKELVLRIAKNAKVQLTDAEAKEFVPELKEILSAFDQLNEVDTKNTKLSLQPTEMQSWLREDKETGCVPTEKILQSTIHKKQNYFVGPKAL